MADGLLGEMLSKSGSKTTTASCRVSPHNLEAEEAMLGAILLEPKILDEAVEIISQKDFSNQHYGTVFLIMEKMRAKGIGIDSLTLRNELSEERIMHLGEEKKMIEVFTPAMILDIMSTCSSTHNWKNYANIIRRNSILRQMISVGTLIAAMGYDSDSDEDVDTLVGNAVSTVMSLALAHSNQAVDVGSAVDTVMRELTEGTKYYIKPKGLNFVRIKDGDVVVLGAGTSVGKTALAIEWADEWSKTERVTYFEYEMSESDLATRLICKYAGIPAEKIQDNDLTSEEVLRIEDAAAELRTRKLNIEEVWCDVGVLMSKIRREAQNGVKVVFIDHLGLIPFNRKGMNEARAIGVQVTNRLKRLATELSIKIVLLVQINREGQKDNFPKLYHLRDSGEIEQDASVVIMAWSDRALKDEQSKRALVRENSGVLREDEYVDDSFNLIRLSVEKNRNGRLGHAWLLFRGETFTFEDRSEEVTLTSGKSLF